MKRYLLFIFTEYEECGGMNDLHSSYDGLEEAIEQGRANAFLSDRFTVFDREKGEILVENEYGTKPPF